MRPYFPRATAAAALLAGTAAARAHDGHAMAGSHWHASDAWGFVVIAAAIALAVWLGRGGR
ncbi:MAG: hypothetical protein ACYC0T_01915 [Ramlibacter sp.]